MCNTWQQTTLKKRMLDVWTVEAEGWGVWGATWRGFIILESQIVPICLDVFHHSRPRSSFFKQMKEATQLKRLQ